MPIGHDATTEGTPYFFLSYARGAGLEPADEFRRDRLVRRFRENLAEAVLALVRGGAAAADPVAPGPARAADDPRPGRVSRALARCGSFVALYSDDYFSSEQCGREWEAFANRIAADRTPRGGRAQAIIPVLWQPVSDDALPACARDLRAPRLELGPAYGRYGLSYLLRHLPEHRGEYEAVVLRLARRIVDVLEHEAPARAERPVELAGLDDAFHRPGDPAAPTPHLRILIAAPSGPSLPRGADPRLYGPRPRDWRPFVPDFGRPIADVAVGFAQSRGLRGLVEDFEHCAELGPGVAPRAPALLIIDAWAAHDPPLRRALDDFDGRAHTKPWIRPMVVWSRGNPANRLHAADLDARLNATLERSRGRYRSAAPRVLDGIGTVEDFIDELPDVVREAERRYFAGLSHDRPSPSAGAQPPGRPRFRGPGPSLGTGGIRVEPFSERIVSTELPDPKRWR
jgi:FxsC-like protein